MIDSLPDTLSQFVSFTARNTATRVNTVPPHTESMWTRTDARLGTPPIRDVCRSLAGAVALTIAGVVAGFASVFLVDPLYAVVAADWATFGALLGRYVVQPGMGLVAAGYAWQADDFAPLDRMRAPSGEGIAWIVLGPVGYELAVQAVTPLLGTIGLTHEAHGATTAKWRVMLDQPELVVPGLFVMFVLMAPMEELLYRGAIHDVLAGAIGKLGRVVIGGVLFGAMHLLLSGGLASMALTTIFGLILAAGYERTENMAVPIVAHATYWLVFVPL